MRIRAIFSAILVALLFLAPEMARSQSSQLQVDVWSTIRPSQEKPAEGAGAPKFIALTFDDGPDPRFTPRVLSILKAKGVKATFFVVGKNAVKYPGLVTEELAAGHEIGNHTYDHLDMKRAGWADTVSEIARAQDALMSITGLRPKLFRPPRGEFDMEDFKAAKAMGYTMVMWTVGIENHATPTPASMVERVCSKVKSGSVILAHDGILNRNKTVTALPMLIDRLKQEGYAFVTVSELLNATADKGKPGPDIVEYHRKLPIPLRFSAPKLKGILHGSKGLSVAVNHSS